MTDKLKNPDNDKLFEAILKLESVEECYRFFDDLCTVAEIMAMGQRFGIALMLAEGKTYNCITEKTGASAATISRVHKCLNYGADGYKSVIAKLGAKK